MTVELSTVPLVRTKTLPGSALQATVVRVYSSLEELPRAYERLFELGAQESFFHSLPWYRNLVEHALGKGERAQILGIESNDGRALAALPLRHSPAAGNPLQSREWRSLSNYYTTVYSPILDSTQPQENLLVDLAQALRAQRPDVLDLRPLARDSAIFEKLVQALQAAGFVVQTYFCHGNWYYPVNGRSYKEYLDSLRSSVRNIARSKNKKLERTGRARIEVTCGGESLASAIEAYQKVYAASWKVAEPFPEFVPGLIRTCAQLGWLRLGIAYVDDEPAAAQLWVVKDGRASIYKIAYDQKFRELSVGSYLTMHMIERAIDVDKVSELDYLSGDDRYKSDWMSHRREQWGILAMNPRMPAGALAIVRHVGGRAAKSAAKKLISRFRGGKSASQSSGGN